MASWSALRGNRSLCVGGTCALLACWGMAAWPARASEPTRAKPPPQVLFARDIQPIFTARCLKCHGAEEPKAGLSLMHREGATVELESGERAIVPGRPESSELLRRIEAPDRSRRMPPTDPPLSRREIELLRTWIAKGAEWPLHWAYRPLSAEAPRGAAQEFDGWACTPIDQFIASELSARRLSPSPPADRSTLIRRVYFDLIGLPPSPEDVEAFLQDPAPDAFDRLVDRLLASPQYGERWARHWMDVVHFAETHGHDQDRPRENAWPFRDYVIRSFNEDKPYSRFILEQLAGDALYADDPWAIAATGLLASGPWDESSLRDIREDSLDREIGRYLDRDDIVTMVMSTFVSSSVHCARCHDHKFDPISQKEYYALQAVFAGTDKADRPFDLDPQIGRRRRELLAEKAALPQRVAQGDTTLLGGMTRRELAAWEKQLADASALWKTLKPASPRSGAGATLKAYDDDTVLASGNRPDKDTYTLICRSPLKTLTGLRLEVLPHGSLPMDGPGWQDNGNLHLSEIAVWAVDENKPENLRRVELSSPRADFDQAGWSIAMAIDGNPNTAWGIYPQVGRQHVARFVFKEPVRSAGGVVLRIELLQVHGAGHLIGRFRLSATDHTAPLPNSLDVAPPSIVDILATAADKRSDAQWSVLAVYRREQKLDELLAALPKQQAVYCGTNQFAADGTFRPAATPRSVQVLHRGNVTQPRGEAAPGSLSCVAELAGRLELPDAANESSRRVALARWISDPRNVLTWRSIVNRIWHYHFGRGIVDTPNDFGRMGGAPSHPQLLDWLAAGLLKSGGSLKALHRMIVTSAVYRQSSADRADCAAIDGENQYLWRMHRRRLEPESIRDALLVMSGTLDTKMGGPSVRQFIEKPGIHVTPDVDYVNYDVDAANHLRRSVYRFIFRTVPDPFMEALDCPDASQLAPKRTESVTALQALATLNDKFVVRQTQHVADRLARDHQDSAAQIDAAVRLYFGRGLTTSEATALVSYAAQHGLANTCRVLANCNEFLFVD